MTARATRLERKSTVRRKRDPIPWKYCLLTIICGLFLVAGFFYAARQHFSSMSIGMENAELRKEIKNLETIQRNLKLKKEVSLSPDEIKRAAKQLGLQTRTARNFEVPKNKDSSDKDLDKKDKKKRVKANNLIGENESKPKDEKKSKLKKPEEKKKVGQKRRSKDGK